MTKLLGLSLFGFWLITSSYAQQPFEHSWLQISSGAVFPLGNLRDTLATAPQVRLEWQTSYVHQHQMYLEMTYAQLTGWSQGKLHLVTAHAGLQTRVPVIPLTAGLGVSLFYARTVEGQDPSAPFFQIHDNESEFGWNARLRWHLWQKNAWSVWLGTSYEEAWTLPRHSRLLWVGLGGGWQWW